MQEENKEKSNKKRGKLNLVRIQGTNFRWVVPQLSAEIWSKKDQFKYQILDRLLASKTAKKGIKYYSIAIESHADGNPHLDMLLIFEKKIDLRINQLDFLCDKHGNLTRYRSLNQAILQYGSKEDVPLNNIKDVQYVLNEQEIKKDPVSYLMKQVDKNPFGFNFLEYCYKNKHFITIQRWSYVKNKIKDYQQASCNQILKSKSGIGKITPELIQRELTPFEQEEYHSWYGYQEIIKYLNQIPEYGTERPTHTQNLFIHGRPRTGKTSLIEAIQKSTAVYPVGTQNWFPKFTNHTYKLMFWDECRLNMMTWEQMLILLDGRPYDLPYKGGSTLKHDNQLWIMTSNKSVRQHLKQKHSFLQEDFDNPLEQNVIETSFRKRVKEITIPDDKDLFLLLKLIK